MMKYVYVQNRAKTKENRNQTTLMTCTGVHIVLVEINPEVWIGGLFSQEPCTVLARRLRFLAAPSMHILGCCSHPFAHSISEPYNASLYILLQHIPPSPTVAMLRSGPKTTLVAFSA